MIHRIEVENIKCGGCANSIRKSLTEKVDGVASVDVDIDNQVVTVEAGNDARNALVAALLAGGYPEQGSVEGLKAASARARSFVSCAVGRVTPEK